MIQSETFLRSDIQNVLEAIDYSNAALAQHIPTPEAAIFRAGFEAALAAMAQAFAVNPVPYSFTHRLPR